MPAAADPVGHRLGPYRIEARLGEGGMGIVYLASDGDGRPVALKVLRDELAADDAFRRRLAREARAAAEVDHPNLAPVLEVGEAGGRLYLATRYVEGRTLAERLAADGPLPVGELVRLAAQVGAGLDALHRRGIAHRDVKPANILLAADGTAVLADFGLAKHRAWTVLTGPGQVLGTLDYLAPELIRGEPAGPLSDLYALGCVLFECLAGAPPFAGRSVLRVGMAHLEEEPGDPGASRDDVPPALSWTVRQALAKDPGRRPTSAVALARMLRLAAAEGPR
ncbi:MAG TPA: serine/threonine-protein kinase [Actinomycetota bacterium]|nr:serine/threonine-protein kinase [Actinomycetota bacterium]